ncbi:unnamed protein product [Ambrosiozyma monospora]|uniref:Unnamed protein product n=1 Tax=Ambrosiozyma monospora TaxID=43982 RepID=A0ACB5T4Z7_AMBMO|nr:unnamed protein product [Ambrosiozyma monospora]
MNFSLDWSNITSSVMLNPYWTIVLQFLGFACTCWVAIPFFKWFQDGRFSLGLMNNHALLSNGENYPLSELVTPELKFNETAYEFYGPIHFGSQRLFNIFFDYAAYASALITLLTFGFGDLKNSFLKMRNFSKKNEHFQLQQESEAENDSDSSSSLLSNNLKHRQLHAVSSQYSDRINKLYSVYEDVPTLWFVTLFLVSFTLLSYVIFQGYIFIPWKTYLVALCIGAIIVIPMSYLYAISNFQLAIGTFNELLYGVMIQNPFFLKAQDTKHPVGAAIYGAVAGNCWYRAQYILQDQKIGLYNQIPPKYVFFSQIFGDLLGVPVNYASLQWVLSQKLDYLRGTKVDPLHQWTGQSLVNYSANSAQYVLVGPSHLFAKYPFLPYGFIFGALAPLLIYGLSRVFNLKKLKYLNTTILFSSMSTFYGNISTGYLTQFLIGSYVMYYLYNFKKRVFKKFNYVLAAAFDTGFNMCNLFIFVVFGSGWFSHGEPYSFPAWWGNDPNSVEKCYAL